MCACLDAERPCTGILRELSVSLLEGKVGKLSGGLLFVGIDGFDVKYADRWATDWWEEIREDSVHCTVPCPEAIESGDIGTASSPRLWSRVFTGTHPHRNGVLGFWEKMTEDGEAVRANVDVEWMREKRCEKLVDREDLLVPPFWTVLLRQGFEVGMVTPWFSYPLQKEEKELMGDDSFFLTDFPFPREDLDRDRYVFPVDAAPKNGFEDQVGAGGRMPLLAQRKPRELVRRMVQQDVDRYSYAKQMLSSKDPDIVSLYLRGVDGMQHILHNQEENWRREGGFVQKGETVDECFADPTDLEAVYMENMDGMERLWNAGDFDTLVVMSDHGSDVLSGGDAHQWPAHVLIYSPEFDPFDGVEARYEDVLPTVMKELGAEVPEHVEGGALHRQIDMSNRLRDLGYI